MQSLKHCGFHAAGSSCLMLSRYCSTVLLCSVTCQVGASYLQTNVSAFVVDISVSLIFSVFLPRDARSAKCDIAIVSRPSVRHSICP